MVICSLSVYERLYINFIPTLLGYCVLPISIRTYVPHLVFVQQMYKMYAQSELYNIGHVGFCTLLLYLLLTTIHRTIPLRLLCLLRFLVVPPAYISQKLWYMCHIDTLFHVLFGNNIDTCKSIPNIQNQFCIFHTFHISMVNIMYLYNIKIISIFENRLHPYNCVPEGDRGR